jgi:hypothetical protein
MNGITIANGKLTAEFAIEIGPGSVVAFAHSWFAPFTHNGLSVYHKNGMAFIENLTDHEIEI